MKKLLIVGGVIVLLFAAYFVSVAVLSEQVEDLRQAVRAGGHPTMLGASSGDIISISGSSGASCEAMVRVPKCQGSKSQEKLMIDQSVKVRHEERLATTSGLNPTPGRVTGHSAARGKGHQRMSGDTIRTQDRFED